MISVELHFHPHPAQAEVLFDPAKVKVLCAGRRFGKDILSLNAMLLECLQLAANREPSPYLNPHVHAWVVGPSYAITTQAWRDLKGLVPRDWLAINPHTRKPWIHDSPPYSMVIGVAGKGREILIEVRSADRPDDLVGSGLDFLIITEAARIAPEAWEVVKPTLNSPGRAGKAIINSTPKGRNWFYDLWRQGQPGHPAYDPLRLKSWRFSTFENPYLTDEQRADIEADRIRLGERWYRQEYLAEFVDALGKALSGEAIERCATGELREPEKGRVYTAGADFGRYEDDSVLVIGDPFAREVVFIDVIPPGSSVPLVAARFAEALRRYGNAMVWADATAMGEAYMAEFQRLGVAVKPIKFSAQSKQQLYEWGISLIERGAIKFPPHPKLIEQLEELEYEMQPSGYVRYTHPRRGHDDCVTALFLWCQSVAKSVPEVRVIG